MLLLGSAIISILEISSTLLAIDSVECNKVRNHLGKRTEFLPQCTVLLANIVDELTKRNEGVKAREMKMSPKAQDQITLLVRVIGNLCFRCKHHQDLMRSTLLPMAAASQTGDYNNNPERNALHVVLSCTLFSTACFTLREWSVIAIRNVLEDNPPNQDIVAQLDANGPIQTAALSEAGLKVQLDSKGKVSLSTLKEEND
jgi:ataxin-10